MAKRKPTIGANPLDALLPESPQMGKGEQQEKQERLSTVEEGKKKHRFTAHIPFNVIERARNAVYWTPGLTLADLTERALTIVLDDLERERGTPFPQRSEELKGGRPVK